MPNVRVRVYNTQNNSYSFDQDVTVSTFGEIQTLIGFNHSSRYTDREDKTDPFLNPERQVTKDVTIFESPSKSKAGNSSNNSNMTFKQMLTRGNSDIQEQRAERIAKAAYRAYSKVVMDLEAKRDNILEAIEASKDLSTSNSRDSINRVDNFDAERWVSRFQANALELELVEKELQIASKQFSVLFHEEVNTDTGEIVVSKK
jgi:hypothetical protein